MDGVFAMVPFYEQEGFRFSSRDLRFEGKAADERDPAVVDLHTLPSAELFDFDRLRFPAPRELFLQRWIGPAGVIARGLVSDGSLVGYAVARPARWQISSNRTREP